MFWKKKNPLLKLRTKESVLKYLYEVSANSLKAELAKQGRYKLNMDEIDWMGY